MTNQPIIIDEDGVRRFKANKIVAFLLDAGPFDINDLALKDFSDEDRAQFAQLIGYSVGGYWELSYVSDAMLEGVDLDGVVALDVQSKTVEG